MDIIKEITLKKDQKNALNEGELRQLMYEKTIITEQRRGENGIFKKGEISNSSILKHNKILKITKRKGQTKTNARREAMM